MVPLSHLHIGGTEIRSDQILRYCIGDRARVSKEQAWMPQVVFAPRKCIIFRKQYFFNCLSAGASKANFEYNTKKSRTMLKQKLANDTLV